MEKTIQIPSLTEDIVYCPKCGAINSFSKNKSGKLLNCFCCRCGICLNDLWNVYLEGRIKATKCCSCRESTFNEMIFCIACGAKQNEVFNQRADKISKARESDLISEPTKSDENVTLPSSFSHLNQAVFRANLKRRGFKGKQDI